MHPIPATAQRSVQQIQHTFAYPSVSLHQTERWDIFSLCMDARRGTLASLSNGLNNRNCKACRNRCTGRSSRAQPCRKAMRDFTGKIFSALYVNMVSARRSLSARMPEKSSAALWCTGGRQGAARPGPAWHLFTRRYWWFAGMDDYSFHAIGQCSPNSSVFFTQPDRFPLPLSDAHPVVASNHLLVGYWWVALRWAPVL